MDIEVQEQKINVTLHTKTLLINRGNLGETGFQMGFQRVLNFQNRVSKGFLKGFQNPETWFLKGFKRVSNKFPNCFQTV